MYLTNLEIRYGWSENYQCQQSFNVINLHSKYNKYKQTLDIQVHSTAGGDM